MILTRRFGALRARPVFPSVTEHDERLDYFVGVPVLGQDKDARGNDQGESAA